MIRWKIKRGRDQSVRQGHPWILREDIVSMGKNLLPGTLVELSMIKISLWPGAMAIMNQKLRSEFWVVKVMISGD